MTLEAADVLTAIDRQATDRVGRRPSLTQESPLLQSMMSAGGIPEFPSRTPSWHAPTVLERVGEIAASAAYRSISSQRTSPANTVPSSPLPPSGRNSVESRATERSLNMQHGVHSHGMHHLPQVYRDAFSNVPSVHAEYAPRSFSRASSRSGYALNAPYMQPSRTGSPALDSRNSRRQRQAILSELTDSSDDESPSKKRSPHKSTRKVLKSFNIHASDMGSSTDESDSPSPRSRAPQMMNDPRAKKNQDAHYTTSSTDEDRNRRRAWEESVANGKGRHQPYAEGSRSMNDAESSDEESPVHESMLQSALSVVRGLEQGFGSDEDDVPNLEEYLSTSHGHPPSSNQSTARTNRQVTKATVAPDVQTMLEMVFQNAQDSPLKKPAAILSASRSPAKRSPQVFSGSGSRDNFLLKTEPACGPASDIQDSIGLPVCHRIFERL